MVEYHRPRSSWPDRYSRRQSRISPTSMFFLLLRKVAFIPGAFNLLGCFLVRVRPSCIIWGISQNTEDSAFCIDERHWGSGNAVVNSRPSLYPMRKLTFHPIQKVRNLEIQQGHQAQTRSGFLDLSYRRRHLKLQGNLQRRCPLEVG